MAKTKIPKETITPSDDLIAQAILEGQALIAEGKSKVEATMAIDRHLHESPQETVINAFIEGASLTPRPMAPPTLGGHVSKASCRTTST